MPFRPPVVDRSTRYRYRRYSHPSVFCNPVNFFRLFPLPSLPRSSRSPLFYFFLLSIHQPFFLSSRSLLYSPPYLSIVPVLSYTALLLPPSSSSAISLFLFHPASCAYPVIISSPFLLVFFYRSYYSASLPRFSLLSTSSCVSRVFPLFILLYPLSLLYNLLPLSFIFSYISTFLCPLSSFLIFF